MTTQDDRWPEISHEDLISLWHRYAPSFIRLDDPTTQLPRLRSAFLQWLEDKEILQPGVPIDEPLTTPRRRIKLQEVSSTHLRHEIETMVQVGLEGRVGQALRRGVSNGVDAIRLPAEATAEAINRLLPVIDLRIEDAYSLQSAPPRRPVAVVVATSPDDRHQRFVGAAAIHGSASEAAAKATLAAINRRAEIATALYS